MNLLEAANLSVTRRNRPVLRGVNLTVTEGEVIGLIGPNGAGKTTLMRALLGLVPATADRNTLAAMTPRDRGRRVAWLPQAREIAWPVDVETLITLGRLPHLAAGQRAGVADAAVVDRVLAQMALEPFRHRTATRLSGGEQARVLIARTLAQDTPLLMADEPIAGLDPAHQISTMATFSALAGEGRSVLVSLHDLGLAARHCTRLVVLAEGAVVADGPPAVVLTPALVEGTFGVTAWYEMTPQGIVFQPLDVTG